MNRIDEAALIIRKACRWNKSSLPSDLELVCCLSSMGNKRVDDDGEVVQTNFSLLSHADPPYNTGSHKAFDRLRRSC